MCYCMSVDRYFYPKLYGLDRDMLLVNMMRSEEERSKGVSSLLPLQRQALLTGGDFSAFLLDAGSQLMVYRPMAGSAATASGVGTASEELRVDVLESDDWIVNDVLRRRKVNPASALADYIHAESGSANADLFNRYLVDDTSSYALSFPEYVALLRKTVVAKINSVL
jgi:hypothetical protein